MYAHEMVAFTVDETVLKIHQHRYLPLSPDYGPAIANISYQFKGVSDRKYGYCWGFSTMNRNFTNLAFFDKDNFEGVPDPKKNATEWLVFYKPKIDQIVE